MLLERIQKQLGWPSPEDILQPKGTGPALYARLAQEKVGRALSRGTVASTEPRVGVLVTDSGSVATEAPLAIVCEFEHPVSEVTFQHLHTLAWNFSRSPLLITLDPTRLRTWSCYEAPRQSLTGSPDSRHAEIEEAGGAFSEDVDLPEHAARALDWVRLASGEFFRTHAHRFPRERRVDRTLLQNLRFVRGELAKTLDLDVAHDLLARLIFIQFLFQRQDSSGTPALDGPELQRLYQRGILRHQYGELHEILRSYQDSYRLFRWLNTIFNGDLFPAKSQSETERDQEWAVEERQVRAEHLRLLAEFVSGTMEMADGQRSLWPLYSFDTIPLEFISSVYEEFVHQDTRGAAGAHYTPLHLADFILDAVLPWNSDQWDLRILDPACGSGVFLVKAFQRLVHRWKNAHPGERISAEVLRRLLEQNLMGIDRDGHAVRVASLSLYLAMCDEIDPRDYWKQVRFPILRGHRLIAADFFSEENPGLRSKEDCGSYDLVVGNAPWGDTTVSSAARAWAKQHEWPFSNKDVGPLFLAKGASLARPGAHVAMLQPAGLLLGRYETAAAIRRKLFSTYKVEEVINLAALRRLLFAKSRSPACAVVLQNTPPDGEPLRYICPKPRLTSEDQFRVTIDTHDVNEVYPEEAAEQPWVWTALMWGGRRDLALLSELQRLPTLALFREKGLVRAGAGVEWGNHVHPDLRRRRILKQPTFPKDTLVSLDVEALPSEVEVCVDPRRVTDAKLFDAPQLIIKRSWTKATARFRAALVSGDGLGRGVVCTQSYLSVHADSRHRALLDAAFLAYNSAVAVYHLLLTSGRMASYRPEALVDELLHVPLPMEEKTSIAGRADRHSLLSGIRSFADIEARSWAAYDLPAAHQALVEDIVHYTPPNFREDAQTPGWQRTRRAADSPNGRTESELRAYCEYFLRVLKAAFGGSHAAATIFQDPGDDPLPVRLVAIHLDWPRAREDVRIEHLGAGQLRERLLALDRHFLRTQPGTEGGIFYQRVARIYATVSLGQRGVPTVYLVKPDQARYWTRSLAMRDADEVIAESGLWRESTPGEIRQEVRA